MTVRFGLIALLAALLAVIAAPAWAQATDAAVAELTDNSIFVETGAEEVDQPAMQAAIATAASFDIDLKVAVFAGGNAEPLAATIAEALGDVTVLVFTPSSFGVFSNEISQVRLDTALTAASDDLSGPDAASGARAFADALTPQDDGDGVSTALVVAGVVGLLAVVGIGGRVWEVRTRDARHARRRERRQAELSQRTREIGGRVVELSDPVEIADDAATSKKFATATGLFDDAEAAIAAAPDMHELDAVSASLDRAQTLLDEVAAAVGGSAV